ncbi:MAG: ABC transporter permease [Bacteroidota bacterium]
MASKHPSQPPHWLLRFFRWFCHPDYVEDIEGDLLERYAARVQIRGGQPAPWFFFREVLALLRPNLIRPLGFSHFLAITIMFKHSVLISYRRFLRDKTSFLINLTGLSTGLACVLFIFLWVRDERKVDSFHHELGQIYQVMQHFDTPQGLDTWDYSPMILGEALRGKMPEVATTATTSNMYTHPKTVFSFGEKQAVAKGRFGSSNFFEFFSFTLVAGDEKNILRELNHIAISHRVAEKLFGTPEDALGKIIRWENESYTGDFKVGGVFEEPGPHSTMKFEFILPYQWQITWDEHAGKWSGGYGETYVRLKKGADPQAFDEKMRAFHPPSQMYQIKRLTFFTRPYADRYLRGNYEAGVQVGGRIVYVRLFSLVALFILLIACFNFINLSTAQANKKLKEIGVKKTIGARRPVLAFQFLVESVLLVTASLLVALLLVQLSLPAFNELTAKSLALTWEMDWVLGIAGIAMLTGLVAGLYPAVFLSRFQPKEILKGLRNTAYGSAWLRKGLVIFQFSLSVILIVGVMVVQAQIQYTQNKHLGYDREQVVSFERGDYDEDPQLFLNKIRQLPGVVRASNMVWSVLDNSDSGGGYSWSGEAHEREHSFKSPRLGYEAIETLGMEIIQGRSFSQEKGDDWKKVILNEAALALMGLENPIGYMLDVGDDQREIIGVVKDFHYGSIHHAIDPMIMRFRRGGRDILVKLKAGAEQQTLAQMEEIYHAHHPAYEFNYHFLDEDYQRLYEAETRVGSLSRIFGLLAILISCLGLLGLAIYTAERRAKELGIRKVLGATVWNLMELLSRDFTRMVLAALTIALPVSYFLAKSWLTSFAYHIELEWYYFLGAGLIALLVAWLTIGLQTYQAASLNPIHGLRDE